MKQAFLLYKLLHDACFFGLNFMAKSSKLGSDWVGWFLYTEVCMVWSEFKEHLVSENGMLP